MNYLTAAALAIAVSTAGFASVTPAFAQSELAVGAEQSASGSFIKKKKKLKGDWEIVQRGGKSFIVFSEDFRAAKGPDLKVFLSPTSIADLTGKTAVDGSINIGELKSTKGGQEYEIPAGVNLSDYASVLVHCEAYEVLWGGSDL